MTDFDGVYRAHVNAVFRYAVRVVGRRDVAEELTNDAFLALFRAFDTIDTSQLPRWLFTVVRNRATDYWRRATLEQRYLVDLKDDPPAERVSGVLEWLDATPALKPVHRACLILRYVHGLERAEIASRLGLSENQVKGYLQYARQLLRKQLIDSE
ncbi:MAG: RNA polymerase sigma factor [Vicinamibacterales bacterium]